MLPNYTLLRDLMINTNMSNYFICFGLDQYRILDYIFVFILILISSMENVVFFRFLIDKVFIYFSHSIIQNIQPRCMRDDYLQKLIPQIIIANDKPSELPRQTGPQCHQIKYILKSQLCSLVVNLMRTMVYVLIPRYRGMHIYVRDSTHHRVPNSSRFGLQIRC